MGKLMYSTASIDEQVFSFGAVVCPLHPVGGAKMLLILLLCFFLSLRDVFASFRRNFVPPKSSPALVEGDIAVPEAHLNSGKALDAFLTEETSLWPRGYVPYRIDTFEWEGVEEPIFLDEQIDNITLALNKIMTDVPCLKFQ